MRFARTTRRGFTLIELIIVIGVITILSAAIFVAIDPVKRINASRNSVRRQNVEALAQGFVARLAAGRTIDELDTEPGSWQMIGVGENCDVDICPGNDGIVSEYSLALDGVNDHIEVPSFSLSTTFSVSLWARFMELGTDPILSTEQAAGGAGFLLSFDGGQLKISVSDGVTTQVISSEFIDPGNVFHHIAFTYAPSATTNVRIFFDGTEVGNSGVEAAPTLPTAATLYFGASPDVNPVPFTYLNGRLDDIRFFSAELTPEKIADLASGKPLDANMSNYWPIEAIGNPPNPLADTIAGKNASYEGNPFVNDGGLPSTLNGLGTALVKSECFGVSEGDVSKMPQDPTAEEGDTRSFYIVNRVGGSVVVRSCLSEGEGFGGTGNAPLIEAAR